MAQTALEKLFFSIGLIDKVTGPSKGINKAIMGMQRNFTSGLNKMALGSAGIYGVASSLVSVTGAARGFDKAINEVASLGTSAEDLMLLGKASNKFAMQFGGDAAAIVGSGYDIKSAINGLKDGALASFTYSGALLAKAGKADTDTATKYMGSMFNIFSDQANKMGQAKWVEELTGKTAHAVKVFKTTTGGMSAAFSNLGSIGNESGIDMNQQMAMLGTLQGSMSPEQAGTAFKSMITKMGQAQKKLGVSFKGTDGNLLPLNEIIMKIEKNVGSLDKNARIEALTQAFGEQGAMAVVNMLGKTDQLKKSIEDIAGIKDASGAEKMAKAMIDPWERLQGVWNVIKITIGKIILPGINAVMTVMSEAGVMLVWLLDVFPPLRWAIGGLVAAVTALAIGWGTMKLVVGAQNLWAALTMKIHILKITLWKLNVISGAMTKTQRLAAIANFLYAKSLGATAIGAKIGAAAAWVYNAVTQKGVFWTNLSTLAQKLWTGQITAATLQTKLAAFTNIIWTKGLKSGVFWTKALSVVTFLFKGALIAVKLAILLGAIPAVLTAKGALIAFKIVTWLVTAGLWGAASAVWAFTVALLANPITWVVLGIMALIGAIYLCVKYWDVLKAAFSTVVDFMARHWQWLLAGMLGPVGIAVKLIIDYWDYIVEAVFWCFEKIKGFWTGLLDFGKAIVQGLFSWIIGKIEGILGFLTKIPFIGGKIQAGLDKVKEFAGVDVHQTKIEQPVVSAVTSARTKDVNAGGVRNTSNNRTTNYGGVTINTSNPVGPGQLEDMWALQA